ncbi:unnamed protein product [Blepharisma stoltei]|uniref:Uncharacterized protein n=1 Tax=Blepharisma stoltei TaxID=1481888 RepID=A0AAU9INU5_9CILI|nr:unnamed protein product [Blepharisma stoltei]
MERLICLLDKTLDDHEEKRIHQKRLWNRKLELELIPKKIKQDSRPFYIPGKVLDRLGLKIFETIPFFLSQKTQKVYPIWGICHFPNFFDIFLRKAHGYII